MPRKRKTSSPKKKPVSLTAPLTLSDKLRILDLIQSGKPCTEIAKMYGKNECTIRRIKRAKNHIRALAYRAKNRDNAKSTATAPSLLSAVLTLGDKMRIIELVRNEKKEMSQVAEIYGISCDDVHNIFVNEKYIQERAALASAKTTNMPKTVHVNPSTNKRNPQTLKIEPKVFGKGGKRIRLSIREKLKILNLLEHEKKSFAEVAKIMGRSDGCIRHILENSKRLRECGPMLLARKNDEYAVLKDEVIMKTEQVLYSWVMDMNNRGQLVTNKMISEKALELYNNLARKLRKKKTRFSASYNWVLKFKQSFNIKTAEANANGSSSKFNGDTPFSELENKFSIPKTPVKGANDNGDNDESLNQSTQSDTSDMDIVNTEQTMNPAVNTGSKEWTFEALNDVLRTAEVLMEKIIKHDPSTDRSTNLTQGIIQVLEPLYEISDNLESEVDAKILSETKQESDDFQPSMSDSFDETALYYNMKDILQ